MTEYQKSLQAWAAGLSDEQLNSYMSELEKFTDDEVDALFHEDIKRMS